MKPIIEVCNISKRYQLFSDPAENQHRSLKKTLHRLIAGGWQRNEMVEFWALQDISFSLHPGEVVAILGHNGSGKSTLLKLMSRIIEPTKGKIILSGRLGALLEIGTGMHPDLTGLENIYFCGALLGMKKKEVVRHLDEIIAFAEIEAFLQTPFKKYSSGMALRLAASILLHLKTDILILDEILSVGDYDFQSLCFDKIKQVANDGRLVLCVTHHEEWISTYCKRALLLKNGQLMADGSPVAILKQYHNQKTVEPLTVS
jgi:lipopolysaccharide transport system ATP-binding protein